MADSNKRSLTESGSWTLANLVILSCPSWYLDIVCPKRLPPEYLISSPRSLACDFCWRLTSGSSSSNTALACVATELQLDQYHVFAKSMISPKALTTRCVASKTALCNSVYLIHLPSPVISICPSDNLGIGDGLNMRNPTQPNAKHSYYAEDIAFWQPIVAFIGAIHPTFYDPKTREPADGSDPLFHEDTWHLKCHQDIMNGVMPDEIKILHQI